MTGDSSLQGKQMAKMAEGPQVITGESSHNAGKAFLKEVLEQMEKWSSEWASMKAKSMQMWKGYAKVKEELEELKDQYKYTEWEYTQMKDVADTTTME